MKLEEIGRFKKANYVLFLLKIISNVEFIFLKNSYLSWTYFKILSLPQIQKYFISRRVSVQVKAIVKNTSGKAFLVGIENLSKSGLLIAFEKHKSDLAFEVGELVHIHFVLKPQLFVKCSATIVRQHKYNLPPEAAPSYGIKITHIDSNSKLRMARFLEEAA